MADRYIASQLVIYDYTEDWGTFELSEEKFKD